MFALDKIIFLNNELDGFNERSLYTKIILDIDHNIIYVIV